MLENLLTVIGYRARGTSLITLIGTRTTRITRNVAVLMPILYQFVNKFYFEILGAGGRQIIVRRRSLICQAFFGYFFGRLQKSNKSLKRLNTKKHLTAKCKVISLKCKSLKI